MMFDVSPAAWQIGALLTLAMLLGAALIADLRQRRIPNRLVLLVLGAGCLVHVVGPVNDAAGLFSYWPGSLGAQGALLGALSGLALFLPLYALRATGAGDVKLMAGIGSFAGPVDTLNLTLFIFAMGGLLALLRMLWTGTLRRGLGNVMLMLLPMMGGGPGLFDPATHSVDRMPYVLAMVTGLLAYGAWIVASGAPLIRL